MFVCNMCKLWLHLICNRVRVVQGLGQDVKKLRRPGLAPPPHPASSCCDSSNRVFSHHRVSEWSLSSLAWMLTEPLSQNSLSLRIFFSSGSSSSGSLSWRDSFVSWELGLASCCNNAAISPMCLSISDKAYWIFCCTCWTKLYPVGCL